MITSMTATPPIAPPAIAPALFAGIFSSIFVVSVCDKRDFFIIVSRVLNTITLNDNFIGTLYRVVHKKHIFFYIICYTSI